MLLHIFMEVNDYTKFSLVPGVDIALSYVITLYLFCQNQGWLLHTRILSCGGYAFFQVHKNLK